jgi:hypothetical protein
VLATGRQAACHAAAGTGRHPAGAPAKRCARGAPATTWPVPGRAGRSTAGHQDRENRNSANTVPHYGEDTAPTGREREHAETGVVPSPSPECLGRPAISPLLQQVLASRAGGEAVGGGPARAGRAVPVATPNSCGTFARGWPPGSIVPVSPQPGNTFAGSARRNREDRAVRVR